jgi:Skp family chaperone for outer membrane proteins
MNKIYLALPLMLSLVLPARAQEAGKLMLPVIAVVDIQKIMRESNASKAVREQLSAKSTDYQKEITEGEKKLRSEGEALMKQRKDLTAPITIEESGALLKLALAYSAQNNEEQLSYLRDYFGPLMKNNPDKPVFDFITNPDVLPTPRNFDEVVTGLSNTRSFLEVYRARIKSEGLSAVAKP